MFLVIAACTTATAILLWVGVALLWLMGPASGDDWALEGASGSLLAIILTFAAFVLWAALGKAA